MNAFDTLTPSTGDAGLASLLAAAAPPAGAAGVQNTPPAAAPFAQLLEQLNAVPLPVASAERSAPVAAAVGQSDPLAGALPRLVAPVDRAPVRLPTLPCGLHLPSIGKNLPASVASGTILPDEPATDALPAEVVEAIAALAIADQPTGPLPQDIAPVVPQLAAQPIPVALRPPVTAPAAPLRAVGGGTVRADQPAPREVAPVAASAPASPSVTLLAAEAPAMAAGEMPAVAEPAFREPGQFAPFRLAMPMIAEHHGAVAAGDPLAAAPQLRPEAQQPAMQDLTRIVERLAAAREAAAPAATELAVDHAEFGPLSLSIRQGGGGELAIAVAAADRDSQVALVAAIAQGEAPGFEQAPDRRGSESPAREPATSGQQAEQRGQGGQRDRFAGQQQQRQALPQRGPAPERDGETRSGTYA